VGVWGSLNIFLSKGDVFCFQILAKKEHDIPRFVNRDPSLMENPPFEDVSSIKNGGFSICHVSFFRDVGEITH